MSCSRDGTTRVERAWDGASGRIDRQGIPQRPGARVPLAIALRLWSPSTRRHSPADPLFRSPPCPHFWRPTRTAVGTRPPGILSAVSPSSPQRRHHASTLAEDEDDIKEAFEAVVSCYEAVGSFWEYWEPAQVFSHSARIYLSFTARWHCSRVPGEAANV